MHDDTFENDYSDFLLGRKIKRPGDISLILVSLPVLYDMTSQKKFP